MLREHPDDDEALFLLAVCAVNSGNPWGAVTLTARLLERHPLSAPIHRVRADALARLGYADESVVAARTALHLDPADIDTQRQLIYSMLYADVSDRALIRATNRLLELAPEDPASRVARGDAFVAMRRTRRAEAAFRRALELDPNDSSALRGLAAAQQKRGMFGDSVSVLATDLAVRPADDRTLTLLRQALVAAVLRWEVSLWATWLLLMIAAPTVPDAARFGAQLAVVAASIGFAVWFWRRFGRSSRRGLRPALRQARSRDRFLVVIAAAAAVGWVCCAAVPFAPGEGRDILLTTAGWTFFGAALLTGVRWTLK